MSISYIGWDVGGAHLKVAQLSADVSVSVVRQLPCPLWKGMSNLRQAVSKILRLTGNGRVRHAVTMSGEMADCFPDRDVGVQAILSCLCEHLGSEFAVYSCRSGLLDRNEAVKRTVEVASANWHATGSTLAVKLHSGLLVDIGSTTTDIVPFAGSKVVAAAENDRQRLVRGELLYTGVVRTSLLSLADSCLFMGDRMPMVAEDFATMSDVWRILGDLPVTADQFPSCDGAPKTKSGSARRLARMFAQDYDGDFQKWHTVASFFAQVQKHRIKQAILALLSRPGIAKDAPIVGAGTGRFLLRCVAREIGRAYLEFSDCVSAGRLQSETTSEHASAVAVALLLRGQFA